MVRRDRKRTGAAALLFVCAAHVAVGAHRLPLASFTTAQGLAHNRVGHILRCSRDYLWFSTPGGLSRFDGQVFVTYGPAEGLLTTSINRSMEDSSGSYWVATWGEGLYRMDPKETDRSRAFRNVRVGSDHAANKVHTVIQDRAGRLWAGALGGLYVSSRADEHAAFQQVDLRAAGLEAPGQRIMALLEDREGTLWIGGDPGLLRLPSGGRPKRQPIVPDASYPPVHSLMQDREGRIWVGHRRGLTILLDDASQSVSFTGKTELLRPHGTLPLPAAGEARTFSFGRLGQSFDTVTAIMQAADGSIWWTAANRGYLFQLAGGVVTAYGTDDGLNEGGNALQEDHEGNIWIGSVVSGAQRLRRGGFTSFDRSEGLDNQGHAVVFESRSRGTMLHADDKLYRFDRDRFVTVTPLVPPMGAIGLGDLQLRVLEDRSGQWWLATSEAVHRFPAGTTLENLESVRPEVIYRAERRPREAIVTLFEDSRSDVWIGLSPHSLLRWERRTGRLQRYGELEGLPPISVQSIAEDRAGNIWVGLYGGLARFRGGRFERFAREHGMPDGTFTMLFVDDEGRLWIARDGAVLVDDPTAERPTFRRYTRNDGLATHGVTCFTEDRWGRIYLGTVAGIDRLEPKTGRIRHYSLADGLSSDEIDWAQRSSDGALWFTARRGVSRLVPRPDAPAGPPPSVHISAVGIAGAPQPIAVLGQRVVEGLRLSHAQNRLQIDFGSVTLATGRPPRYQYLLEGTGGDWSPATDLSGVHLAGLAAGTYRLLVRAVDGEGRASATPASVSFVVLPPFWRTWWFVSIVLLVVGSTLTTLHKRRVARAVEMERVRTRIATDLHDDVGSSLTQIAILSEVALRDLPLPALGARERLARIAGLSRTLVENMSDIVWTINPASDRIADLLYRMRRFASDVFAAGQFRILAPKEGLEETLDAEVRRQTYLVFKECVNNAVRHSGCTEAEIRLAREGSLLVLSVRDNGSGFDPAAGSKGMGGQGLTSMRLRAEKLGGTLDVESRPGAGTTVTLSLPLKGRPGRAPTNLGGAGRPHRK